MNQSNSTGAWTDERNYDANNGMLHAKHTLISRVSNRLFLFTVYMLMASIRGQATSIRWTDELRSTLSNTTESQKTVYPHIHHNIRFVTT